MLNTIVQNNKNKTYNSHNHNISIKYILYCIGKQEAMAGYMFQTNITNLLIRTIIKHYVGHLHDQKKNNYKFGKETMFRIVVFKIPTILLLTQEIKFYEFNEIIIKNNNTYLFH